MVIQVKRSFRYMKQCKECWARISQIKQRHIEQLNWAGDPCSLCGKYPLSYRNTSGMCKRCSQNHRGGSWYQRNKLRQGA